MDTVYIITGFNTTLNRRTILHCFSREDTAKEYIKVIYAEDEGIGEWSNLVIEPWVVD